MTSLSRDRMLFLSARYAYEIHTNPGKATRHGPPPGYRPVKTWRDPVSGFKGVALDNAAGDRIYAVAGTEGIQDALADVNLGAQQIKNTAFGEMVEDAVLHSKKAKISFTGHSLGGGVAEAAAYLTARVAGKSARIDVTSWNGLGGKSVLERAGETFDPDVQSRIAGRAYGITTDPVSRIGEHVVETYRIPRSHMRSAPQRARDPHGGPHNGAVHGMEALDQAILNGGLEAAQAGPFPRSQNIEAGSDLLGEAADSAMGALFGRRDLSASAAERAAKIAEDKRRTQERLKTHVAPSVPQKRHAFPVANSRPANSVVPAPSPAGPTAPPPERRAFSVNPQPDVTNHGTLDPRKRQGLAAKPPMPARTVPHGDDGLLGSSPAPVAKQQRSGFLSPGFVKREQAKMRLGGVKHDPLPSATVSQPPARPAPLKPAEVPRHDDGLLTDWSEVSKPNITGLGKDLLNASAEQKWKAPGIDAFAGAFRDVASNPRNPMSWAGAGASLLDSASNNGGLLGGALAAASTFANAKNPFDIAQGAWQVFNPKDGLFPAMAQSFSSGNGLFGLGLGIFHEGGEVTDRTPTSPEPVVVQEGEFVLSPTGTKALGSDLAGALNRLAADPGAAEALKANLETVLGSGGPLSEKGLRDLMEDRRYWDKQDPDLVARVAAEFKLAYPGGEDGKPIPAEGGLVSDGDPRTTVDDLGAALPEGAFVFSREAVKAFGPDLLARLNAHALAGDHARLAQAKRAVAEALGLDLPLDKTELAALLRDPRYEDTDYPGHEAYFQSVRHAFERAYPD